ncbi:MAG: phosphoribosyltransferase domain-containing protein, partial [Rectinema sp.]|nr:phosphoribosyltransferase domain-containing protein [Rectinema sp.]
LVDKAIELYVQTPALVNVMLNYKICVEHGLPLHPTVYYELREAKKYRITHSLGEIQHANELFWRSIDLARACYCVSSEAPRALEEFASKLPRSLETFVYTGIRDNYTWKGSNPELLESLAAKILHASKPRLLVAAAHGSIMPGLLLADFLEVPAYFIRFSMFKRLDEEPIVSLADQAWLFDYRDEEVVLYDEDVAGGRTLDLFARRLDPLFKKTWTACSIRHAGASIRPDFCGRTWWD